jgi:hypothetical protein
MPAQSDQYRTYHLPYPRSIHPRIANDALTPAFCSDLSELVEGSDTALWGRMAIAAKGQPLLLAHVAIFVAPQFRPVRMNLQIEVSDVGALERFSTVLNRKGSPKGKFSDSESVLVKEVGMDGVSLYRWIYVFGFLRRLMRG